MTKKEKLIAGKIKALEKVMRDAMKSKRNYTIMLPKIHFKGEKNERRKI